MIRRLIAALALAGSLACSPALEPNERAVVNIDGTNFSRGELEAYLAMNLVAEAPTKNDGEGKSAQGDLVRSRLLDTWIDEQLVLFEAVERQLSSDSQPAIRQRPPSGVTSPHGPGCSKRFLAMSETTVGHWGHP